MLIIFALPVMALFEGCIWLIFLIEKRRARLEVLEQAKADRPDNDPLEPLD